MVKASAQITLFHVIDIKASYRYYLLQSSTLAKPSKPATYPPSSSWSSTEPSYTSGSTNSLYFVDCTVFGDDTFMYSDVSLSTSYEAAKEAYNKAVAVNNRIAEAETLIEQNTEAISLRATKTELNALVEGNLIVNGFGLNKDNYNFSQWTFSGTDKCEGFPSFYFTGAPRDLIFPQYMVPIDINKTYEFSMFLKGDTTKKMYLGWDEFDIDGKQISATNSMGIADSTTTLSQDLNDGDTVVHLTSASGWDVSSSTPTHKLGLIFWNYKDSTGYQYPIGVYSRNSWTNLYTYDNVDRTNNTITLKTAWNHGTFYAGTAVSQSSSSGHKYFNYSNAAPPADWKKTSFIIGGEQELYKYQSSKINQATKYMRFLILHNYSGGSTTATTSISRISLVDTTLKKSLTDNYYTKTDTDALIKVESDRITSAVTRIGDNETAISTLEQTAEGISLRIDNLQIGGRNYIKYGKGDTKNGFFTNFDSVENGYGEHTLTSKKQYSNVNISPGYDLGCREYEVGRTITFSYDIMYTNWDFPDGSNRNEFWIGQRYTSQSISGGATTGAWRGVTQFNLPVVGSNGCTLNEWYHFEAQRTIPEQASEGIGSAASIQFYNNNADVSASVTFRIKNVKLEYGEKATDWTPSPEEVNTDISNAEKVATDYMSFNSTDGLVVGDMTSSTLKGNIQLKAETSGASISLRDGTTILSKLSATSKAFSGVTTATTSTSSTTESDEDETGSSSNTVTSASQTVTNDQTVSIVKMESDQPIYFSKGIRTDKITIKDSSLISNADFTLNGRIFDKNGKSSFEPITGEGNLSIGYGRFKNATSSSTDSTILYGNKVKIATKKGTKITQDGSVAFETINGNGNMSMGYHLYKKGSGDLNLYSGGTIKLTSDTTTIVDSTGNVSFEAMNNNGNTVIGYSRYANSGNTNIYGGSEINLITNSGWVITNCGFMPDTNASTSLGKYNEKGWSNIYIGNASGVYNGLRMIVDGSSENLCGRDSSGRYIYGNNGSIMYYYAKNVSETATGTAFRFTSGNFDAGNNTVSTWLFGAADSTSRYIGSYLAYNRTYSSAANMFVTANGVFGRSTSSSARYKHDISDAELVDLIGLYSLPVKRFKYRDDYIAKDDELYGKYLYGIMVEDLEEILPCAVQHIKDENGNYIPEMWNSNIIIPSLLKLIQDLNNRLSEIETGRRVT